MIRLLTAASCALLVASCSNNANNVVLSSLDRSAKLQLLCADVVDAPTGNTVDLVQLLPLQLCVEDTTFAPEVQAQILGAVTQSLTGTVASISFTDDFILDTNVTVPGVTALVVGEQPTGIQISPVESGYTYVSSFSPKSVQAIPTEAILTGTLESAVQAPIQLDAGPTDLALYEKAEVAETFTDSEGRVTGARSVVDFRYLYVAIPELGQVAEIEVEIIRDEVNGDRHGLMGVPTFFQLPTYDCDTVTPVPPPASTPDDYHRICPMDFEDRSGRFIKTVETTSPCIDGQGTGPSPVALTVDYGLEDDPDDDVLLVADANQPVIHRFGLSAAGATALDPIVAGTPTDDVTVTPYVPASSDADDRSATERYLYAVSAADSSVLAINYTEDPEGTPENDKSFGAVLPVVAGVNARANEENTESRNRVRFGFSNVRSIEVVSPFYELESDPDTEGMRVPADDICSSNDADAFALAQNEANMRGVFLAVSLSNGTMFFLDIYDLNAPCRGGEGAIACTLAETGPDQFASIRRNRRRIGFTPSTFIDLDGTPSLQFNAALGQIDPTTGQALNSDGPGLEFIDCRPSMIDVFGVPPDSQTDGLICASSQVWSGLTEQWEARWAGLIPNTEGGLGSFSDESFDGEPGTWFLAGDVPFCEVGVLGRQPGPEVDSSLSADRLSSYVGDRLVIVGDLPPNRIDDPRCELFTSLRDDLDDSQVWFPILRAFNDELEIGESVNSRYTLDQVRFCFNQFTEYQIHTQEIYTVTGSASGFIHRVIPDASTGQCIFDPTRPIVDTDVDTFLTGRAFEDTLFINPLVEFKIGPFPPMTSTTDSTVALLTFSISNQFTPLSIDTSGGQSSLPSSMLFSAQQDQLFFVDFQVGVRRMVFSPLSIVQTFN